MGLKKKYKDLTEEQTDRLKERVLDGLKFNLGVVSYSLDPLGLTRYTFDQWYKEDDRFRVAVDDVKENALDYVEKKQLENIKKGDQRAIENYLNKQGKHRGWGNDIHQALEKGSEFMAWSITPVRSNPIEIEEAKEEK